MWLESALIISSDGAGSIWKAVCLVPFTSFCDADTEPKKTRNWFATDDSRPLVVFAGIGRPWDGYPRHCTMLDWPKLKASPRKWLALSAQAIGDTRRGEVYRKPYRAGPNNALQLSCALSKRVRPPFSFATKRGCFPAASQAAPPAVLFPAPAILKGGLART